MQQQFLNEFGRTRFDAGLVVNRADIIDNDAGPVLLIHYTDERRPDQRFAGWWEMRRYAWGLDPREVAGLAGYAKIWLEELFQAGPALEERPVDEDGVLWVEMETLNTVLPPPPPLGG
jgi:hypothetical protein